MEHSAVSTFNLIRAVWRRPSFGLCYVINLLRANRCFCSWVTCWPHFSHGQIQRTVPTMSQLKQERPREVQKAAPTANSPWKGASLPPQTWLGSQVMTHKVMHRWRNECEAKSQKSASSRVHDWGKIKSSVCSSLLRMTLMEVVLSIGRIELHLHPIFEYLFCEMWNVNYHSW